MLSYFICFSLSAVQFGADFTVRFLDRHGWTGPKTNFAGYSGFTVLLDANTDIDTYFAAKRTRPEVLILPLQLVTDDNLWRIQWHYHPKPYLQGFVILGDDHANHSYDVPFPNSHDSYYPANGYKWNTVSDSLCTARTELPLVYPSESVKKSLLHHIATYGPRAGIYMRVFMEAAQNDAHCLKDGSCEFIGGISLFGSFKGAFDGPGIWAISSMDTKGLFPYGATGADSSISGFVAHLLALELFKDVNWTYGTQPLRFAFFDAEANGYLGGHRFLKDVMHFQCNKSSADKKICHEPYRASLGFQKVSLTDLLSSTVIEMISVANVSKLYGHSWSPEIFDDLKGLKGLPISIEPASSKLPGLPPSSMHSFMKYNSSIKHMVLAGFNEHYPTNNRYGSPSDVLYDIEAVARAAQTLALILAHLCNVTLTRQINRTIVRQIMEGFIRIPKDSPFLVNLFPGANLPKDHVSLYSGVYNGYIYGLKHRVVRALLLDAVADNRTEISCDTDHDCAKFGEDWICGHSKVCQHSVLYAHPAYSSAYEFNHTNKKRTLVNTDPNLPRGVESNWIPPDLKLVTLPYLYAGRIVSGIGVALWVLSALLFGFFWTNNLQHLKIKE